MEFPIFTIDGYSLWVNWVSNIGAIIILVVALFAALFVDPSIIDVDVDENWQFAIMAVIIGIIVAVIFAYAWPLIIIVGGIGLILGLLRIAMDRIREFYFYQRYDR